MSLCEWLASRFVDLALEGSNWTPVTYTEVALWIGNPGVDTLGGAEVSGGAYARQTVGITEWTDGILPGGRENSLAIVFPTATDDWGEVTHIVLFSDGGIAYFYGALTLSKEIATGSVAKFNVGALEIAMI